MFVWHQFSRKEEIEWHSKKKRTLRKPWLKSWRIKAGKKKLSRTQPSKTSSEIGQRSCMITTVELTAWITILLRMAKCSRSSSRSRNLEPRWNSMALSTEKLCPSSVITLMISSILALKSAWKYMIAGKSPLDRAGIRSYSNQSFRASQKCWMIVVAIWCCSSMVCRSYILSWSAAVSPSVKHIIRLRNTHLRAFLPDCSRSFRCL